MAVPLTGPRGVKIRELQPFMKAINCRFIVLEKESARRSMDGNSIHSLLVADETACVTLSLWDELGEAVSPGDILQLENGYASLFKGALVLYVGTHGRLKCVGEFCMLFDDSMNMSKLRWDVTQQKGGRGERRGRGGGGRGRGSGGGGGGGGGGSPSRGARRARDAGASPSAAPSSSPPAVTPTGLMARPRRS
eukprot:PLAT1889.1.p1 GENE.PLAT1889.1~~PLAT1889.1.p1  ORF type:complete len:193 (+),score=56.62 PLAT1889.1:24-602(+)